jgi:hypothetical protein
MHYAPSELNSAFSLRDKLRLSGRAELSGWSGGQNTEKSRQLEAFADVTAVISALASSFVNENKIRRSHAHRELSKVTGDGNPKRNAPDFWPFCIKAGTTVVWMSSNKNSGVAPSAQLLQPGVCAQNP